MNVVFALLSNDRRRLAALLIPTVVIVLLGGVAFQSLIFSAADRIDRVEAQNEQRIVETVINNMRSQIEHDILPSATWDETYDYLSGLLDETWARDNLGPFSVAASGVPITIAISSNGSLKYLFVNGKPDARLSTSDLSKLQSLVPKVLRNVKDKKPVPISGVVQLDGEPFLAALSPVTVSSAARSSRPFLVKDVLIFAKPIDRELLQHLSVGYRLESLRLAPAGNSMYVLPDPNGASSNLGLSWKPAQISSTFLDEAATRSLPLGIAIIVALVCLLCGWHVTVRTVQQTRENARNAEVMSGLKSQFLANMSHELRTPLNGVVGMLNLLQQTHLDKQQENLLDAARQSGETLLEIVSDILDFSKIEAGRLEIESASLDLAKVVETATWMMAHKAQAKGLELCSFVSPELPKQVRGDAFRIKEVLANFISNAVKFTELGEVTARAFPISRENDRVVVRFEVEDTGIGIDDTAVKGLFQNFSQMGAEVSRKYGGTGLGLAISANLVKLMEGRYGVNSAVGKGSMFWFELPLHSSAYEDVRAARKFENLKVLVVDDQPRSRQILSDYVTDWGMLCATAANGNQALEKMTEAASSGNPFALVLLDQDMPGIDGLTTARKIKSDPMYRSTKITLLSPVGAGVPDDELLAHNIDACVVKPVRHLDLFGAILNLLQFGHVCPESRSLPAVQDDVPARSKGRILIAEDNPVNLRVTRGYVESMGYAVDTVPNGAQAVEATLHRSYDAILMDCRMPGMDGLDATREIRRNEGSECRVPIIALTADVVDEVRARCLHAGMDAFVSKPVMPDRLALELSRWVVDGSDRAANALRRVREDVAQDDDLLDTAAFQAVQAALGKVEADDSNSIVTLFLQDAEWRIAELKRLLAVADAHGIAQCAHGLKGAASDIGAIRIMKISRLIDANATSKSLDGIPHLLVLLDREFKRTRALIEAKVA